MKNISFSFNWNNKLNCYCFTSIRIKNDDKYIMNENYEIILKGKIIKKARLINIKDFKLKDIPEITAFLDTGYNKEDTINILKEIYGEEKANKVTFSLLLFKSLLA